MYLKSIELLGFKSFGKKETLSFTSTIAGIVGPNGSGKSNVAEAFRFVLGEQSMKSLRSKKGKDLIWGGSPTFARANRAGVRVTFDNSSRFLDIDFPEVVVERIVHRDGANEYLLNGSSVRLKDVIRLLAGANIGGSGYQIISQGEADRILNSSPKERREMVEDALGLKLYQHKKQESERKLLETAQNIEKTKSLRRELAPHLNFLKIQMEKQEKLQAFKLELIERLNDYLAREHSFISGEDTRIGGELTSAQSTIDTLNQKVTTLKTDTKKTVSTDESESVSAFIEKESTLRSARAESERIGRDLGRAEGALDASQSPTQKEQVPVWRIEAMVHEIEQVTIDAEHSDDIERVRQIMGTIRGRLDSFLNEIRGKTPETNPELLNQIENLTKALTQAREREAQLSKEIFELRERAATLRDANFAAQRDLIEAESNLRDARNKVQNIETAKRVITQARERFETDVREGIALVGIAIHTWEKSEIALTPLPETREAQEKRRRDIERLKIKLEEGGGGSGDEIIIEFNQTRDRDLYLAKELSDLETSSQSLNSIISDLEVTIDKAFNDGLVHINTALNTFFSKLFNGGSASLTVETPKIKRVPVDEDGLNDMGENEDEESLYRGLSIAVSLPRKKINGLESLSGGERALTSIALIFSMSQVNPPPFLILDETDAALDEANSKRYADMIKELGTKSQLIVITHNRSTMAAAGELYGVTMGSDGVSKLLSVKLEEAARVAK